MLDGLSTRSRSRRALQALAVAHAPSTALGARLRAASAILVIGASSKAEARLLWDSNYWEEMRRHWPAARRLVFVGPEIAAAPLSNCRPRWWPRLALLPRHARLVADGRADPRRFVHRGRLQHGHGLGTGGADALVAARLLLLLRLQPALRLHLRQRLFRPSRRTHGLQEPVGRQRGAPAAAQSVQGGDDRARAGR